MADQFFYNNGIARNKTLEIMRQQQIDKLKEEIDTDGHKYAGGTPIEAYRKQVFDSYDQIAPVLNMNMAAHRQLSEKSMILSSPFGYKKSQQYASNVENKQDIYHNLFKDITQIFQNKQSTGQETMLKAVQFADTYTYGFNARVQTSSSYKEVERSIKYLTEANRKVITFDIETFGGRNAHGKQTLDMITEFAFLQYDNFDAASVGANQENYARKVTGFVGIQEADRLKYEKMIERYVADPLSITEKDRVTLNYLAKLGDSRMAIEESKPGRFTVTGSPDAKDVKLTEQGLLKGLRRSMDIGKKQNETRLPSGIMQWEKDLADGILMMQDKSMGASVLGHNVLQADIPWLNEFMANSSGGFKDYIRGQGGSTSLRIGRHRIADTLPLLQHAMSDEAFERSYLDANTRKLIQELNIGPNSLEVLANRSGVNKGAQASHTAEYDSKATLRTMLTEMVGGKNILTSALEAGKRSDRGSVSGNLKGDGQQLFLSTRSMGGSDFDKMLGFRVDPFDGHVYTSDGFRINPRSKTDGNVETAMGEWLTKKGVTYQIDGITPLESIDTENAGFAAGKEYVEKMRKIHPALAVDDLVMMQFSAVSGYNGKHALAGEIYEQGLKQDMSSFLIGSKREVQNFFNNNMLMYAEKDEDGKFQLVKNASPKIAKISFEEQDGLHLPKEQSAVNLIEETIRDGVKIGIDDGAARTIRDLDYSKFKKISTLSDELDKQAENMAGKESFNQKRAKAMAAMIENSRNVATQVAEGRNVGQLSSLFNGTLQEILGYVDRAEGQRRLHPRAIDNAIGLVDYVKEMRPILAPIMSEVEKISPLEGGKAHKQFLFAQGMDVALHHMEQFKKGKLDNVAATIRGTDLNYYEIDMNRGANKGTPLQTLLGLNNTREDALRVNLRNGEYGLLRKLEEGSSVKGDAREQKKKLMMLIDHEGIGPQIFGGAIPKDYLNDNPSHIIAKDFIRGLQTKRQKDSRAGFITNPTAQTVTGMQDVKEILGNKDFDHKNAVKESITAMRTHKAGNFIDLPSLTKDETQLNRASRHIVNKFLMDNFDEQEFRNMGYDDKGIKWLRETRQVRERDYTNMMKEILKGASNMDMSMRLDEASGSISVQRGSQVFDLADLPRERIVDGTFYTQVGRSKLAPTLEYITNGAGPLNNSNVSLMSGVGKSMANINWSLEKAVITAQQEGRDPMGTFQSYIRNIASDLRTGSSVEMLDEQDDKAVGHFQVGDIYNNLNRVNNIQNIRFGDESATAAKERQLFLQEIGKKKYSFDKSDDAFKSIVAKHEKDILSFVFGQSGLGENKTFTLPFMSNRQKGDLSALGAIKASIGQHELEAFNSPMRAFESSARYLGAREDKALAILKDTGLIDGVEKDKVYLGANMRTALGQQRANSVRQGLSERIHTEMTVKRAYVGAEDFVKKVYDGASTVQEEWASERIRTFGTIYEGSAVASSKLGDAFLQNYDRQRISFARKMFDEHSLSIQKLDEMKAMTQVVPKFYVDDDGKVQFEYKKGKYVKSGETLMTEIGYGNKEVEIAAKYDGALRMGFFSKSLNVLASEQEVADAVYARAAEKGFEVKDKDAFMQVANQIYNTDFYSERINQNTYRKLHEDRVEKGMTRFAYAGLGDSVNVRDGVVLSGDVRITNLLNNLGLGSLKGSVLNKELFDELTGDSSYGNGFLQQIARAENKDVRGFSDNEFTKAFQAAGFKNQAELRRALMDERHELSNYLETQFNGAVYYSQTNDKGHKNVSRPMSMAVANMFADESNRLKGADPSLSRSEREALASQNVVAELDGVFQGKDGQGLSVKNGRIAVPDMTFNNGSFVQRDKLEEAYNKRMGDNAFGRLMTNGNTENFVSISTVEDYTGMTGAGDARKYLLTDGELANQKGFKVTDREMIFMKSNKIDNAFIQKAKDILDPETFNNAFGFMTVDDHPYLKDEYKDRSMFDPFIEKVQKDLYAQNGDVRLMMNEKGEFLQPSLGEVGEEIRHTTVHTPSGPVAKYAESAKALHAQYGGAVSENAAKTAYMTASNLQAIRYNQGDISKEALTGSKQFGFQEMKLGDIDFTSGGDRDFFIPRKEKGIGTSAANSIYGQNTIIDLSDVDSNLLRDAGITSKSLAIGAIQSMPIGDEMMQRDPHKILKDVRDNVEALRSGRDSGNMSQNKIKNIEDRIVEDLSRFNDNLSEFTTGKESDLRRSLSEIRLEKSATAKASLLTLLDPSETGAIEALKNAKVDGKSILEHHQNGALMDFRIVSKQHIEKMGLLDENYLQDMGVTKDEMLDRLRGGVPIMAHRNPTLYESSMKPVTMIYSDHVKDTQVVDYAAGAMAAKEDADGDQVKSVLLSAKDQQGKDVDYLQYQNGQRDNKLDASFNMYKAQMYKNAIDTNPYYRDSMQKDINEIRDIDEKMTNQIIKARSATSDTIRPELTNLAEDDLRKQYYNDYVMVENRAMQDYQTKTGSNLQGEALRQAMTNDEKYTEYIGDAISKIDPDAQAHYGKATDYYLRDMSFLASRVGANKQSAAGQVNLPLYKIRKVRNLTMDAVVNDGRDHRFFEHVLEASEESFLTPKHNESKIVNNTMVVREFNDALQSAVGGPYTDEKPTTAPLVNWFEKNLEGRFKEDRALRTMGESYETLKSLSPEERRGYYNEAASMIQDTFSHYSNIDALNMQLSTLAQTKKGVNPNDLQKALIYTDEGVSMLNTTMKALGDGHSELGIQKVELLNHTALLTQEERTAIAGHEWTPPESGGVRETTKNLFAGMQEKLGSMNLKGRDLAFGALGLAGATMLMGFVGGNPAEKSTVSAAAGMEQDLYSIPTMTDDAVAMMQENPNQGYIININAGSPKGQKQAEEAVRQAMATSSNMSNINIAMNINNNSGNITDSTIERMINGVMGS